MPNSSSLWVLASDSDFPRVSLSLSSSLSFSLSLSRIENPNCLSLASRVNAFDLLRDEEGDESMILAHVSAAVEASKPDRKHTKKENLKPKSLLGDFLRVRGGRGGGVGGGWGGGWGGGRGGYNNYDGRFQRSNGDIYRRGGRRSGGSQHHNHQSNGYDQNNQLKNFVASADGEENVNGDSTYPSSVSGTDSEEHKQEIARAEQERRDAWRREREEENKKMTLQQYEKKLLQKRKALESSKAEERKVTLDKEFEQMQIVRKKQEDNVYPKLNGEEKLKKNNNSKCNEKVRKTVSAAEFLKLGRGEYYTRHGNRFYLRKQGNRLDHNYKAVESKEDNDDNTLLKFDDSNQFPALGSN